MWYLASTPGSTLPREQVPVGSAAAERQQGNLPGTVPATKVVWSRTHGPASLAGSPARWATAHADTDAHGLHCRAEEPRLGSDARKRRSDAWTGGCSTDPYDMETGLQGAKPKGASSERHVATRAERNGFVSGRKP
jgi:hypothetical protein